MPVDVSWLYKDRVIKIRHYGRITSEQLIASMKKTEELTLQGQPPVHSILDGSAIEGSPAVSLGDLRRLIPTLTEGTGLMLVIQPRVMDRFFTSLGMQIAGARYKFVPDEAAAIRALLEHDPSLQDLAK